MKNLQQAMKEEKLYVADRMNNIDTSFPDRLKPYGYENLEEYFKEKREYLFKQWKPEVYYVDVRTLTTELENAVQNEQYGIYISTADSLYAFHGSDDIDYELCEQLGVCVAELYHQGGTIIGDKGDFGIEIVAPKEIGLNTNFILNKFFEIIDKYEDNAVISGNDILINNEKVLGSMCRSVGDVFVWAAQVSFEEHDEIIKQVCQKQSSKKAGRIKHEALTKEVFEKEVLKWLQEH